jgi:K+-sensing histidine kinase KdpD
MKPIRSILAAVNVQRGARAVLSTASMLAQAVNARLHVVHAIEFDSSGFPRALRRSARWFSVLSVPCGPR